MNALLTFMPAHDSAGIDEERERALFFSSTTSKKKSLHRYMRRRVNGVHQIFISDVLPAQAGSEAEIRTRFKLRTLQLSSTDNTRRFS